MRSTDSKRGINPQIARIAGKGKIMATTLTPKEIAQKFATDAKTLRKFLRKDEKAIAAMGGETPGKGGRWAIPANQVKSLQKRFDAWNAANQAKSDTTPDSPEGDDEVETPKALDETVSLEDEDGGDNADIEGN